MTGFRRSSYGVILVLSTLVVSPGLANDHITSITETFLLEVLNPDGPGITNDSLRDLAEERARVLIGNAGSQTGMVLGVAIPDPIASLIDTSLLKYVEEYSEIEGYLATTLFEYDDFSHAHHLTLQPTDGSDTVFLHFDGLPPSLPVGRLVSVRGVLLPQLDEGMDGPARHMVLRSAGDVFEVVSETDVITAPSSVGRQRTGIFLARFSDDPDSPTNLAYAGEWVFDQLDRLLRWHSVGRTWLLRTETERLELATARTCDREVIQQQLFEAIAQSGNEIAAYDRIFLILPSLDCGWRTATVFPGSPNVILVNEEPTTKGLLYALLHGLGVPGYQTRSCDFDTIHSECRTQMGSGFNQLADTGVISISPYHKERVNWMSADSAGKILPVDRSGEYRLWATDALYVKNRRMALKIGRRAPLLDRETTYYVEYRVRKLGGERLPPEVVIYVVNGPSVAATMNLTSPGPVPAALQDTVSLLDGRFIDHAANLEIEIAQLSPWTVDLDISYESTSCVPAAPNIEIAPPDTSYILAESSLRFSLAISSRDSSDCGPLTALLHLRVPDGWSDQEDPQALVLEPDQTVQMDVLVAIPPAEKPGFRELEWVVQGDAPIEARRSTMLFVMPTKGGSADPIPEPTRTVNVSNGSQLTSAINSAQPGDHIVLANGSYGFINISKSGVSGKPIVIRAANILGAKFTSGIHIDGDYVWVVGMNLGANVILINSKNVRVSRNYFKSNAAAIYATLSSRYVEIDHNEHAGGAITIPAAYEGIGAGPILMRYRCSEQGNHHVHHNYIHDGSLSDGTATAIFSGSGSVCDQVHHHPAPAGTLIEYNLISNWNPGYCLRTKSGSNTIRFNTCIGGKHVQNRHGAGNEWIANWFEGVGNVYIFDSNHEVIGNRLVSSTMWIGSGSLRHDDPFESGYITADNALVVGNNGPLVIGKGFANYNSVPVKDVRVEAHVTGASCDQGSIRCVNHTGTSFSATTNRTIPQAFKLTTSDVGPFAPTAPRL